MTKNSENTQSTIKVRTFLKSLRVNTLLNLDLEKVTPQIYANSTSMNPTIKEIP